MRQDQYSTEIARVGGVRTDSNLPDSVTQMVNQALDPMYDTATPDDTGVLRSGTTGSNTSAPTMDFRLQPSYRAGGLIGPGGQPQRPAGLTPPSAPQAPAGGPPAVGNQPQITAAQMQAEIQRFAQTQPQRVAVIKQAVMKALQSGDLDMRELNLIHQLAMAAAQNPQLYPQLRQYAIQQGLATDQDLPMQYDRGLVFTILLACQSVQASNGAQAPSSGGGIPQANGQPSQGAYKDGGALPPASRNKDGSIHITAHEGEYVVPSHVVRAKGTDFFDKMIESYNPENAKS